MTSSSGFLEAIEIRPGSRGPLLLFRCALSGLGAAAVHVSSLPFLTETALQAMLIAALMWHLLRAGTTGDSQHLQRAVLSPAGQWRLTYANGSAVPARLVHSWGTTVGPILALEWLTESGRIERVWLMRGQLPEATWRRLRARLHLP